jgi:N-acetyl-gamma-glutamylphosphate reductase
MTAVGAINADTSGIFGISGISGNTGTGGTASAFYQFHNVVQRFVYGSVAEHQHVGVGIEFVGSFRQAGSF